VQSIQLGSTGKASSIVTAALAAAVPGLGHIYRRRFVSGAIYLAACSTIVAVLLFVPFETRLYGQDEVRAHVVLMAALSGLWAWQIIDAARTRITSIALRYVCGHSDRIARAKIEGWISAGSIPSIDLDSGFLEIGVACNRCTTAVRRREAGAQIKRSLMDGLGLTLDAMFKRKVMIASLVTFDILFGAFFGFMVLDGTGALAYLQASGIFFDPTDGQIRIRANMFTLDITDSGSAERVLSGGLGPTEALLVKQAEAAMPNLGSADILWLDSQNRIVQIISMAQCEQQECVFRPSVDSESVLYLAEGTAGDRKIKTGDSVNLMLR
jgi:hypothetical protein